MSCYGILPIYNSLGDLTAMSNRTMLSAYDLTAIPCRDRSHDLPRSFPPSDNLVDVIWNVGSLISYRS